MPNLVSTVDALPAFIDPKNIDVFIKNNVFTEAEIHSRYEILLENYSKTINIEALTMLDMAKKQLLPAMIEYIRMVCDALAAKKCLGLDLDLSVETELAQKLSCLETQFVSAVDKLESDVITAKGVSNILESAQYYHDPVFADMQALRAVADEIETLVGEEYWPIPTYTDLLF